MDILIIVLLSLVLVLGIVLLIVLLKKKNTVTGPIETDNKDLWELSKQIQDIKKDINNDIKLVIKDEVIALSNQNSKANEQNNEKLERFQNNISKSINERFDALNKQMDTKLNEMNKKVDDKLQEGFKGTTETIAQVRERLQAIDDAQKNLEGLSKDVVSLKQVLEGNQTRGQYGEYQLEMVLHNVFGDTEGCYELQHTMKKVKDGDDVRADAAVFMPAPNNMICIDSKFPFATYEKLFDAKDEEKEELLKQFKADVKKHITAIKEKYIVEGKTAPEAMMFIPNDGVFAFIHHNCQDVVEYAREKRVIIASPSTLPPMLVTINMVKIETKRAENAREISLIIQKLSKDFEMFDREWGAFSKSLENVTKKREDFDKRVTRLTGKFSSIKTSDIAPEEIEEEDKPQIEDIEF